MPDSLLATDEPAPVTVHNASGTSPLLIVADHINNSGKLMLEERASLDMMGFQAVYFFPYPESVIVFDKAV